METIPERIHQNIRNIPGEKQQENVVEWIENYYLVTEVIVIPITM